jgi:NADH:ubiquinone reductase (non-electrogenic)
VGELHDFINDDVARWYPDLKPSIKVTLVEASDNLLGTFDQSLAKYVMKKFKSRNINIRLGTSVTEYKIGKAILSDGSEIPNGKLFTFACPVAVERVLHHFLPV